LVPVILGTFEAHVTVRPPANLAAFRAACDELGVKCVEIELPVGETPAQPMTASLHHGAFPDVLRQVEALARTLVAAGFEVVRTKIEAMPDNAGVPATDDDAAAAPGNYFEYHVKLVVPPDADLSAVAGACEPHGARLSRNARTRRPDGAEERFVTLRVHAGRATAEEKFEALAATLASHPGIQIEKQICEYTVFDSDRAVDRGWL
jgi:hypothetical protein